MTKIIKNIKKDKMKIKKDKMKIKKDKTKIKKDKMKIKKDVKIKSNDLIKLVPRPSTSANSIPLKFPGIRVAQCEYHEGPVGLTYIHFNRGARVYMEARGGYPAYISTLSTHDKQLTGSILIAGGSVLGLEANAGVIAESMKSAKYRGWHGGEAAIIYSHNLWTNKIYPDKALGRFAFNRRDKYLYNGQVGAGLSAAHGQGFGYRELVGGMKILALCVNNAVGTVYKDNKPAHYWRGRDEAWLDKVNIGKNTTIIVMMTNVDLDHDELRQMNQQVNVSIGESIRPFNTLFDGDVLYTCSTRKIKHKMNDSQLTKFFMICSDVLKEAIHNSIL
jgi:L-aminopeptidase/D-esterase-like protein